jgi:hypothetical protein
LHKILISSFQNEVDSFKSVHNLHTTPRSQLEAPCLHPLKKKAHSIGIPFIKSEQQQPPRRLSGAVTLNKAHELTDSLDRGMNLEECNPM